MPAFAWRSLLTAILALLLWYLPAVDLANRQWLDLWQQHQPTLPVQDRVVVIGIDDAFLQSVPEPLALLHPYLATLFDGLAQAHPAAVGVDMLLPQKRFAELKTGQGGDYHQQLAGAIYRASRQYPLVFARSWDNLRQDFQPTVVDYLAVLKGSPYFSGQADPRASVMLCPDADGFIRALPGPGCQPAHGATVFSTVLAQFAGAQTIPDEGLIQYRHGTGFDYLPMARVLDWIQRQDQKSLQQAFGNKVVLLGVIVPYEDRLPAPIAITRAEPHNLYVPGTLIHAQLVRNLLENRIIQTVNLPATFAPLLLLLGLAFAGRSTWVLVGGAILALFALGASLVGLEHQVLLPLVYWLGAIALAVLVNLAWLGWQNFRDKRRITSLFSGYVSPQVMKEILAGRLNPGLSGHRGEIAVLFADIRGFTTLSEKADPEALIAILNRYFDAMTEAIHRHGGTLDKYIGDGIMAFFGAPQPMTNPSRAALLAAGDMLAALAQFNESMRAEGHPPLAIGIGLHSGDAVVGHVGSKVRHEYTAIGDTVNTASRLESATKELGFPIVLSAAIYHDAEDLTTQLKPLGEVPLKGRSAIAAYGWDPIKELP